MRALVLIGIGVYIDSLVCYIYMVPAVSAVVLRRLMFVPPTPPPSEKHPFLSENQKDLCGLSEIQRALL